MNAYTNVRTYMFSVCTMYDVVWYLRSPPGVGNFESLIYMITKMIVTKNYEK